MINNKVLFLINKLGVGGAERVFIKDANALNKEDLDVYFGFLYGCSEDQLLINELTIKNENIFYPGFTKFFDLGSFIKLVDLTKKNEINVIYSTLDESNIIARLIKIFNPKVSVVIREANVAGPKPLWFKVLDLFLNPFVKSIICVSEEVKSSLIKYQPFFKSKMLVLMNGVFIPKEQKVYDFEDSRKMRILNVGSLMEKKGQKFLVDACSIVQKNRPDTFELNIFGSGKLLNNLKTQIAELGLEDVVKVSAPVSSEDLSKIYLASDIFVLSSLWEGCPNVLLEAMAHGLASISTKVSGASDIVLDNKSGILVEREDSKAIAQSIIYLMDNKNLLSEFGNKSREIMEREFSFGVHINKLKSILL